MCVSKLLMFCKPLSTLFHTFHKYRLNTAETKYKAIKIKIDKSSNMRPAEDIKRKILTDIATILQKEVSNALQKGGLMQPPK